jgi:hypothetical protein
MQNVHEKAPILFQTRWVMNFLAGPLTRTHIPKLNELAGAGSSTPVTPQAAARPAASVSGSALGAVTFAAPAAAAAPRPAALGAASSTKPPIPAGVAEYFLPQNFSLPEAFKAAAKTMPADAKLEGVVYRPALLASAQVRFLDRKYGVDSEIVCAALVPSPERRGTVRWEDFPYAGPSLDKVDTSPGASSRFDSIDAPLSDGKLMTALQKDFADWVYRSSSVTARANDALKVYAGPDVSQAEFMKACADAAREARDAEMTKKTAVLDRQIKTLMDKLGREERELRQDEAELRNRNIESAANALELGASLFGLGRKKSVSTQLTKHRLSQSAKEDVEESRETIEQYEKQLEELQQTRQQLADEIQSAWGDVVNKITEVIINPKKTDIYLNLFGVAWVPFYLVKFGTETQELPAFGAE